MELRKKDLAAELAKKSGYYKKYAEKFLDALDDIIVENLSHATFDEDVEIHLAKGLVIGSKRCAERDAYDPRNQEPIKVPEKSIPYARFTYTFKQKINE